jgi:hypothetical protein
MKKKLSVILAAIAATLLIAPAALAGAPTLTIEKVAGQDVTASAVTIAIAPGDSVNVQVRIHHADGGINQLSQFSLAVSDDSGTTWDTIHTLANGTAIFNEAGASNCDGTTAVNSNTCTLVIPWAVDGASSYLLRAAASHAQEGSDQATVTVNYITVNGEFKAAPAVANEYLNSDSDVADACQDEFTGRNWRGQVISAVADWHVEDGVNKKLAYEDANDYDGWVDVVEGVVDGLCDV